MILGLAAMVHAQVWGPGRSRRSTPAPATVTVSGTMVVANGMPALKSGDTTYFVGGLSRLIGFIDGLKEGAQVTIEGVVMTSPNDKNIKFLRPSKLTINGRTYDFAPPERPVNPVEPRQWQWPMDPRFQPYRAPMPMMPYGPRAPRRR